MEEEKLPYITNITKARRVKIPKIVGDALNIQPGDLLLVEMKPLVPATDAPWGPLGASKTASVNYIASAITSGSDSTAFTVDSSVMSTLQWSIGDPIEYKVKKWKRSEDGGVQIE